MIPSETQALDLHRKYGSDPITIRHCKTVARVALALADALRRRGVRVDKEVIYTAALLHDIGRSRVQTVRHGYEGAEMLRKEGVDARVVETVRKHVGAGIAPEEAKTLGLPDMDYIPRTLEERVVCFADKVVDSSRVRPFHVEVERFVKRGHDVKRLLALKESLESELGEDPEKLILGNVKEAKT